MVLQRGKHGTDAFLLPRFFVEGKGQNRKARGRKKMGYRAFLRPDEAGLVKCIYLKNQRLSLFLSNRQFEYLLCRGTTAAVRENFVFYFKPREGVLVNMQCRPICLSPRLLRRSRVYPTEFSRCLN